jgi:hypothetical protein
MRGRKLAVVTPEEPPWSDEAAGTWAADEEPAVDPLESTDPIAHLCLTCGTEDCREHDEAARLDAPSRAVREAIAKLRRAAAEHRAATRALRVLVLTEAARGRGDLETKAAPAVEPCPRCLIRDAEEAAAANGVTKGAARRVKKDTGQQALPFEAPER